MYICTTVTACCMLVIANSIRTHLDCVQVTSSVRFYARFCCSLLWPPKSVAQRRTRRVHSASINVEYTYFLLHPNINQSEIILHILMTIYLPLFFHISFAANEDTSALCSPNLNSPTITFWFRLNKFIIRLCSTHQFKNLQVSGIFLYSHKYKKHWDFAIAMTNLTEKITKSHLFLVDEKVIWKENRKQFLSLSPSRMFEADDIATFPSIRTAALHYNPYFPVVFPIVMIFVCFRLSVFDSINSASHCCWPSQYILETLHSHKIFMLCYFLLLFSPSNSNRSKCCINDISCEWTRAIRPTYWVFY